MGKTEAETESWSGGQGHVQFSSGAQLCPTPCTPMNCSTPGLPVQHQLPEAMLSKPLIQFSIDGWSCIPSLLFTWGQTMLASLVAQRLKHLPLMRETSVRSLGLPGSPWEDPLEKEMATYSSIRAWRIPWMEEPGGLQSTGLPKSWT